MKCDLCGFENDEDARFCENCGEALSRVCPACGSSLKPGARFCKKCGKALVTTAQANCVDETERRDHLAALRQAAPQNLQDKILAARDQKEGERKPVTILFTDIVGCTALAEKLDPEEWKEIVNTTHRCVSEAVYRYEGTIAQLLGDGVLAFFGAPVTHEDDPVRAVRAGLDIQRSIEEYSQQLKSYIDHFQMRIGIHTGTVVVGQVGSDLHMEYLAIGDAVNLASRLQSAAQPGRVLISEATERLVKNTFDLKGLGEINVKGREEAVKVFEVASRKAIEGSRRGIESLVFPIVGREQELAALNLAVLEVSNGHGQIVAILGEAGIGKTRLVEEARRASKKTEKIRWLEGRALSYGQTLSFWTVTQLLKNELGLSDADPEAKIIVTLRRRVQTLFGERSAEFLPFLAHLLGIRLADELNQSGSGLEGETLKRQVLLSVAEYFQRAAQEQPTVLVFEDLHWADPSTLEVLEKLLALTDRAALMVVLLTRTEREHGSWNIKLKAETDYAHRYTEIQLKPLSVEDSNRLMDHLLEMSELTSSIRGLILERSEGNPFYLEEIIRSLIEQGGLVFEEQAWRATTELGQVEIPDTLQGVLLARIDRLQEDVRHTLQLAAVIGKTFLFRLLEAINTAERQLDEHLSQLQRADLVREKARRPELEYMFKHALTQEAAYSSLLIERRKEFHRKVGEALEQLFADRLEEFYGLLAHHFEAAGDGDRAISYWIQAGDKARFEDALVEAIQSYQHALDLMNEDVDRTLAIKTWLKLGLCHHMNFEFQQAHLANEAAFALERKARASSPISHTNGPAREEPLRFHMCYAVGGYVTVVPAQTATVGDGWVSSQLFAGLAEFDSETNVVPHAARSWEVLDEGTRYLFHLRDDVRWSDGTPVTAQDFEWSWKHNLAPGTRSPYTGLLDDIVGARDYHEGRRLDPDSVGVRALDPLTLEVRLNTPAAHFIFLVTQPFTYPLPRKVVERFGEDWWKPESILTNGAFRLLEFDSNHGLMERNPYYFGEFPGNIDQFEWTRLENDTAVANAYQNGLAELGWHVSPLYFPACLPADERFTPVGLYTLGFLLNPTLPPLDDVRIRRAIAHALDFEQWSQVILGKRLARSGGGFVPLGMAGHSPELGLKYDLERARLLLAEAGYPGGKGLPVLNYLHYKTQPLERRIEFRRQLCDHLGIQIEMRQIDWEEWTPQDKSFHILIIGWSADYPDPDNFLRQSGFHHILQNVGWRHPQFDELLENAARTTDRGRRMAMYREADRILVNEEVAVIPWANIGGTLFYDLVKPWVKGRKLNALGGWSLKDITLEPH